MENSENKEIEARFLEIDVARLVAQLGQMGAKDLGEAFLEERIFQVPDENWYAEGKFVRVRRANGLTRLTYKHHAAATIGGTEEIEISVDDAEKTVALLERLGLILSRVQEKKRHTFQYGETVIDIDTWPGVPTYAEIEGASEQSVREVAAALGFEWEKAVFQSAGKMIEERYGIPVSNLKRFMFDS